MHPPSSSAAVRLRTCRCHPRALPIRPQCPGAKTLLRPTFLYQHYSPSVCCRRIHFTARCEGRGSGTAIGQEKSLYDVLGLSRHASQSEIKRKFYELSKMHHPDRNQGDPSANDRFVNISQAYGILSNPISKASYDSTLRGYQQNATSTSNQGGGGPVGGRAASGLSRRRVTPQGPPPSYYRDRLRPGVHNNKGRTSPSETAPHFNWHEKYKQHYAYQQRLRKSSARDHVHADNDSSSLADFCFRAIAVGSCLMLAGMLGGWAVSFES